MKLDAAGAGGVAGAENGGAGALAGLGFCCGVAAGFGGVAVGLGAADLGWVSRLGGTGVRPEPPRGPGLPAIVGFGLDEDLAVPVDLARWGGGRVSAWLGGAAAAGASGGGGLGGMPRGERTLALSGHSWVVAGGSAS